MIEPALHLIMRADEPGIVMMNIKPFSVTQYVGPARNPLNLIRRIVRIADELDEFASAVQNHPTKFSDLGIIPVQNIELKPVSGNPFFYTRDFGRLSA